MREVRIEDALPVAIGAAVLGTGGGGNTYIGRITLEKELRERGGAVKVITADEVDDNAFVCAIGGMGAPTVGIEKLLQGEEFVNALRALEAHMGQSLDALVISEIGGSNAVRPLITALQMGLPIIDGDPMGRAFPELQMDTFSIGGISASPMALADAHGNAVVFHHLDSPHRAEDYGRALTIQMGGSAALAMPGMTGAQMKAHIIRGTLSLAHRIGTAVLEARGQSADVPDVIADVCNGHVMFRGKILDVDRRTTKGFARGEIKLVGFDGEGELQIAFQNENLVAWQNGKVVCCVPDLITLVELETGEPIGTEMLRYGLRVAVLAMPAPKELKTERALEFVGPKAFGYDDVAFKPLAGDLLG
jgi:DUF917 family protein